MLEFVDLHTAKTSRGTRLVASAVVPSPWSEAAKGLFRIAGLPVACVRALPRDAELAAWTGVDNVPAVRHADEPVRTTSAQIIGLVARLAPGAVVPEDDAARADVMGLVELVAGEDGLAWTGRLAMVHAGFATNGEVGFPPPAREYLAKRYGYTEEAGARSRTRAAAVFAHLAARLGGRDYFGGARPDAVDIYVATALTPLSALAEADCPRITELGRRGFAGAQRELGPLVPRELTALRARMFERHLAWPIEL
jgi:glutathione S-transferase